MNFDFLIVGGGTAGYVTALILKSAYPETSIGLIKSDKIGIIGVGEGSTPNLLTFLEEFDKYNIFQNAKNISS